MIKPILFLFIVTLWSLPLEAKRLSPKKSMAKNFTIEMETQVTIEPGKASSNQSDKGNDVLARAEGALETAEQKLAQLDKSLMECGYCSANKNPELKKNVQAALDLAKSIKTNLDKINLD